MTVAGSADSEQKTIEGNLERIDLASVLQVLQNNESEGALEIRIHDDVVTLFFCKFKGVTLAGETESLGTAVVGRLLNQDHLKHEQYDHVMCEAADSGKNPVDALSDMDILDKKVIVETLRECLGEEIYDLFFLKQATFEFIPQSLDPDHHWGFQSVPPTMLELDRLVLEAARRIDEWTILQKKIPSLTLVYAPETTRIQEMGPPAHWPQRLVLSLVDSQRNVDEIIALSYLSKFEVCHTLDQLDESGWIQCLTRVDLEKNGEKCLKKNQADLAIKFFEQALEQGEPTPRLHEHLARAYEKTDTLDRCGRHLLEAAELYLADGRVEDAYQNLTRATEIVPGDLDIHERRMEIYLEYKTDFSLGDRGMVPDAIALSQSLLQADRADKAVEILRRLDRLEDGNLSLKGQVIEILLNRGLISEAVAEYENLGSFLVARGEYEEAKKVFKKILALDQRRLDISEKMKRIERMRVVSVGRRRRFRFAAVLALVAAFTAVGYWLYSKQASEELNRALAGTTTEGTEATTLIDSLQQLSKRFRFSPSVQKNVDEEIRRIEDTQRHAAMDRNVQRHDQEQKAEDSLETALEMVDIGHLDRALIHLQRAIDFAPNDDWIEEEDLENQKTRILQYLQEAENLYARSREAIQANRAREAYEHTRKLRNDYSKSPFARRALLPIQITSSPGGAEVFLNGETQGQETPCVVMFDPSQKNSLAVFEPGYQHMVVDEIDLEKDTTHILLAKLADWKFETDGRIVGSPAAEGGVLYFGSRDATVYAIDSTSSGLIWKKKLSAIGEIESSMTLMGGRLYVGSNDRQLYCLDKDTGNNLWAYSAKGFIKSAPLLVEGMVVFACSKGTVYALDAARGVLRWSYVLDGTPVSSPLIHEASLLVGTQEGSLIMLDPRNGSLLRTIHLDTETRSPVTVQGNRAFLGTEDGRICAIDLTDGAYLWSVMTGGPVRGGCTIEGDLLFAGGDDGIVRAIRIDDGTSLHRYQVGAAIRSKPLLYDGKAYVAASDHRFYCLDQSDLSLRWLGTTRGPLNSSPFEAYGAIYVGSSDHALYAFEP